LSCEHNNVQFIGVYSLIGCYHCEDCGEKIDPVEYHKMKGDLHINLIDYYTEHPEKLQPMWQDHPWVRHLYEN